MLNSAKLTSTMKICEMFLVLETILCLFLTPSNTVESTCWAKSRSSLLFNSISTPIKTQELLHACAESH